MKEAVTIYREWVNAAEELHSNAMRGQLYHAICRYALDGVEPELSGVLRVNFDLMRRAIDISQARRRAVERHKGASTNTSTNKSFVDSFVDTQKEGKESPPLASPSIEKGEKYTPPHNAGAHVKSLVNGGTGYPQTVEDVMDIAALPQCGAWLTEEEARAYLVCRMASDWTDAAGRRIAPGRLVWDLKKWEMKSNERKPAKGKGGVDYSDPSTWSSLNGGSGK